MKHSLYRSTETGTSLEGQLPPGLKLEDMSVLQFPGTKDGQIKVVRESNAGMAYSWDASKQVFCLPCSTQCCSPEHPSSIISF